jgi:hypothetical protein
VYRSQGETTVALSIVTDDPVLIFGGLYGNLEAASAVLAEAVARGISASRIICIGDVVGYSADPLATVRLIRAAGIQVVMGGSEEQLGTSIGAGEVPWFGFCRTALGEAERAWMRDLPRRLELDIAGRRLLVMHSGIDKTGRCVFASTPDAEVELQLDLAGVDGVVGSRCGLPFSRLLNGRLWHDPGAIGRPANDGTPRGWFSVLTPERGGLWVEHVALDYDHMAAAAKMRQAGLPGGDAAAVETGFWPSPEALPTAERQQQGHPIGEGAIVWPDAAEAARTPLHWPAMTALRPRPRPLDPLKFRDPDITAKGERRASVALSTLSTLWFNTGTLCNITCRNCYIESSPRNDRLAYLTLAEMTAYLDEIERGGLPTAEIGFTGGEPFMNPEIIPMLEACLERGFRVLVLTNAMRPMQRLAGPFLALDQRLGHGPGRLTLRVSLDHYTLDGHELERGAGSWAPTLAGLTWLARNGIDLAVAGRTLWDEPEAEMRSGYRRLFAAEGIPVDAEDPGQLVLFPEMDATVDVPEITEACWGILHRSPDQVMCASSRMVVKRQGAAAPVVLACTLLPYDAAFELGQTLAEASGPVKLNHPHCAKFCVLGGAACSAGRPIS